MNRLGNLLPYLILVVVLTAASVVFKTKERADTLETIEVIEFITQRINDVRHGASPDPLLIDVRSPSEFDVSHAKDSVNVPTERIREEIPLLIPNKKTCVMIFSHSSTRAEKVIGTLRNLGYKNTINLNDSVKSQQESSRL